MDDKTINDLTNKLNSEKTGSKESAKVIRLNTRLTRRMQMKLDLEQRKGAVIASVLSVIALATILNQSLISNNQSDTHSRQIASLENEQKIKTWKQDLLKDLSETKQRSLASYGEFPTPLEQLRMGTLEGKYSFQVHENIIEEIKFIETAEGDRPKSFRSYEEFVTENMKAFNPSIEKIVATHQVVNDKDKQFTYEARDLEDHALGKIVVVSDLSNRFIRLTYQP